MNLVEIKVEDLAFDHAIKLWVLVHDIFPLLSSDCIAHHVRMRFEVEEHPLVKAHVVASDYGRWPKLFSEAFHIVDFVTDGIFSLKNEEHF